MLPCTLKSVSRFPIWPRNPELVDPRAGKYVRPFMAWIAAPVIYLFIYIAQKAQNARQWKRLRFTGTFGPTMQSVFWNNAVFWQMDYRQTRPIIERTRFSRPYAKVNPLGYYNCRFVATIRSFPAFAMKLLICGLLTDLSAPFGAS